MPTKRKSPVQADQDDSLLMWYMEVAQRDEHSNIAGHEKRIQFLSGLNVAVLTGVGAGLFHASRWDHYLVLLLGPAFMILTNHFAVEACRRYYNRVLEGIIVRAHLEQALGLTRPMPVIEGLEEPYWLGESPVPLRHLDSRRSFKDSSARWFEAFKDKGSQAFARRLFLAYQALAVVLAMFILVMLCQAIS